VNRFTLPLPCFPLSVFFLPSSFYIRKEGTVVPLPKIFDRFYRVKTEQTRKVAGSGPGLSIVKGVIEAHLGSIEVESEPGKGTTFSVFLPIKT